MSNKNIGIAARPDKPFHAEPEATKEERERELKREKLWNPETRFVALWHWLRMLNLA